MCPRLATHYPAQRGKELVGEQVLIYVADEWALFGGGTGAAAKLLGNTFRYLDRHYIQREREEGNMGVFEVRDCGEQPAGGRVGGSGDLGLTWRARRGSGRGVARPLLFAPPGRGV